MKCPKCDTPLCVTHKALDAERLTFTLTFEGDMLMARTLGECITNLNKLLTIEARAVGMKRAAVFLTSMTLDAHKAEVGLLLTQRPAKSRREGQGR